jgi:hypothetical protein
VKPHGFLQAVGTDRSDVDVHGQQSRARVRGPLRTAR